MPIEYETERLHRHHIQLAIQNLSDSRMVEDFDEPLFTYLFSEIVDFTLNLPKSDLHPRNQIAKLCRILEEGILRHYQPKTTDEELENPMLDFLRLIRKDVEIMRQTLSEVQMKSIYANSDNFVQENLNKVALMLAQMQGDIDHVPGL